MSKESPNNEEKRKQAEVERFAWRWIVLPLPIFFGIVVLLMSVCGIYLHSLNLNNIHNP